MKTPVFHPFPIRPTGRLVLRELVPGDATEFLRLRSDPGVLTFLPFGPMPSREEALAFIGRMDAARTGNQSITWAIALHDRPELIGTIVLWNFSTEKQRAEVGYMLLPEYHGKGYAREALDAVLDYGFADLGLHAVEAVVDPRNRASVTLLERAGFRREAFFKSYIMRHGQWLDEAVYTLLEPAFRTG